MATLKQFGLYFNQPADRLIFLTHYEHDCLHNAGENAVWYGKTFSDEHRQKISKALTGIKRSKIFRKRRSELMTGKNNPQFGKHTNQGTHWYNNGKIAVRKSTCPNGFKPGKLQFKAGRD